MKEKECTKHGYQYFKKRVNKPAEIDYIVCKYYKKN